MFCDLNSEQKAKELADGNIKFRSENFKLIIKKQIQKKNNPLIQTSHFEQKLQNDGFFVLLKLDFIFS